MSSGSVYVLNLEDAPSIRLSGDEITGKNSDDIAGLLSQKLNSLVTQRSIYGGAMDFSSMSSPTLKFNVTLNGTTSQVTFHRSIDPAGNLMSTGNFEIDGDASIHVGLVPDLSGTTASVVTFPPTAALAAGQSVTVAGLTFTVSAGSTATQAQLATAFANLANGATTGGSVGVGSGLGSYTGTFTGFSTGVSNGTGVTATAGATLAVVAAPVVSSTVGANVPFVTTNTTASSASFEWQVARGLVTGATAVNIFGYGIDGAVIWRESSVITLKETKSNKSGEHQMMVTA
jgi:hypothetical protein